MNDTPAILPQPRRASKVQPPPQEPTQPPDWPKLLYHAATRRVLHSIAGSREAKSAATIANLARVSESGAKKILATLVEAGLATKYGDRGGWYATAEGRAIVFGDPRW